jgi:protein TonB
MTTQTYQTGRLSARHLVLLGTLGLHVLAFQLLSLTVSNYRAATAPDRLQAFFIDDPRPSPPRESIDPHPATQPQAGPTVVIPVMPEFSFDTPTGDAIAIDPGSPASPGGDEAQVTQTPVPSTDLAYTARRPPDEFYPPASIRLGEEGVTVLRVCVSASGALDGGPVVTQGSGHPRLDTAARSWASQALAFRPATRDGAPVAACKAFRVRFNLRN